MATKSSKTGFPEFLVDAKSAESARRQFIEVPLEAAIQSAFAPALNLAKLLTLLPEAFAASQRNELNRIKQSAEENDLRVAALETSIEQADDLRRIARLGELRAQRSLVALATQDEIFHGFVSDSELNPLKGLTVQVTTGRTGSKDLSCATDAEGYFRMSLGKSSRARASEKEAANITPEQVAELFVRQEKEREVKEQLEAGGEESRVEIRQKGKLLYEDPVPIALDDGGVYREYVVSDKHSSASDLRDFIFSQGSKPTVPRVDLKEDATEASRAAPAGRRRATKRPARGSKSKPTSKK